LVIEGTEMKKLQQENKYDVDKKQWNRWCDLSQRIFNKMYEFTSLNQGLCLHPEAKRTKATQWNTVAWNTAWVAADSCEEGLSEIVKGKGYFKEKK
jgi:hypothetical protein